MNIIYIYCIYIYMCVYMHIRSILGSGVLAWEPGLYMAAPGASLPHPASADIFIWRRWSWLVWTWVTLNCNAFSLFLSSQFPLVDNPIFWQTQSPVGIPFPPHLLSRQSRWGFGKMSDDFAVVRSIIEDRCLVLWKIVTSPTFSVLLHVKLTRLRKKWPADSCRF